MSAEIVKAFLKMALCGCFMVPLTYWMLGVAKIMAMNKEDREIDIFILSGLLFADIACGTGAVYFAFKVCELITGG